MNDFAYIGSELDLFALAANWKAYWTSRVRQYVHGEVLDVGAGIGSNTRLLLNDQVLRWLCLEPDPALVGRLNAALRDRCDTLVGTVADVSTATRFDCILYIDVLEHSADDRAELATAARLLAPGGRLIVLAPAHQSLFSPFDKAIGHFRRYDRRSLLAAAPPGLPLERIGYLDICGLMASLANRLVLSQSMPTERQILFWDRVIIPCSRPLDRLTRYRFGKSILAVWRR